METSFESNEISEHPNVEDASKPIHFNRGPNKSYPSGSGSCLKSHRSEDIPMREDEDGVRTHFCPLKTSRDSPSRKGGEDLLAEPSERDIEAQLFLKSFSLKSEDITSLVAEKPPQSESDEDNKDSDVDAFTSMIYGSYRNRQLLSADNSLQFLLEHQMSSLPSKTLNENKMSSWLEDSSEDEESSLLPSATDKNEMKLPEKYTELVESDMEEFEKRTESKESGFEELETISNSKQNSAIRKVLSSIEESSKNEIVEKTNNDDESSETVIKGEKSNIKQTFLLFKTASEKNMQKSENLKENSDLEYCPHEFDDEGQINDVLKAVVEQAISNAPLKLQVSPDEICQNSESCLKKEKFDLKSETIAAERHLLKETDVKVQRTDDDLAESNITWGKERDFEKPKENAPTYKVYFNTENPPPDVSVRCKVLKEPDAEQKEEMKGNFAMEPMSLHSKIPESNEETQPDLATALRFMTEVYPARNDDDLYCDTLSNSSGHSSEKSVKANPEASIISHKHHNIQEKLPTGNPEGGALITESGPFEPVIVEDPGTAKRPRNKFSKFFQSFKRRLGKKS